MSDVALFAGDRFYRSQFNTGQASYTIFQKDGITYADPGYPGGIPYSGTDAATVLNNALTGLVNGGRIYVGRATYNVPSIITVKPNITLEFENGTVLNHTGTGIMLDIVGTGQPFYAKSRIRGSVTITPNANSTKLVAIEDTNLVQIDTLYFQLDGAPANLVCFEINGGFRNHVHQVWGNSSGAISTSVVVVHLGGNAGSGDTANSNIFDQIVSQTNGTALLMDGAVSNQIGFLDAEGCTTGLQWGHPSNTYQVSKNDILDSYFESCTKDIINNWSGAAPVAQVISNRTRLSRFDGISAITLQTVNPRIEWSADQVQGWAITTPSVPSTGVDQQNTTGYPVLVYVTGLGSGITAVGVTDPAGTLQSFTRSSEVGDFYRVELGGKIRLTYTGSPTWKWFGL